MFGRISSIFSTKLTSLSFNFKTGSLSVTYKSLSGAKELNFKFYLILSNNFTYSPGVCDCWTMQVWIISNPYHIEFTYILSIQNYILLFILHLLFFLSFLTFLSCYSHNFFLLFLLIHSHIFLSSFCFWLNVNVILIFLCFS